MTTEIRFNGSGVPRIYLKPSDNPIEVEALKQLAGASGKGTVVTLTAEGDTVVLTVKSGRPTSPLDTAYSPDVE